MILTCPKCSTRYMVASHAIGETGRKVRCIKCSNTWFQEAQRVDKAKLEEENITPIPESIKPVPEGSSVPAIKKESNNGEIKGYLAAASIFAIICASVIFFSDNIVKIYPSSSLLYKTISIDAPYPGENLVFEHIETQVENDKNGKPLLAAQGKIINLSSNERKIPTIKATLLDGENAEISSWTFEAIEEKIPSETETIFHTAYTNLPPETTSIKFSFDNGL